MHKTIAKCLITTPNISILQSILLPNKNKLLIFDLDDTIQCNTQYLGRDHWFINHINNSQDTHQTLQLYNMVQQTSQVKLIDHRFIKKIQALRNEHKNTLSIIGLTARNYEIADATIKQLASVGMHFDNIMQPPYINFRLDNGKLISMQDGIIFCNGESKGRLLRHIFTERCQFKFEQGIFIDDKEHHVRDVIKVLLKLGLPPDYVTGIHYNFIQHFDKDLTITNPAKLQKIANAQLEHFLEHNELLPNEHPQIQANIR
jgi:predicted phosphatase